MIGRNIERNLYVAGLTTWVPPFIMPNEANVPLNREVVKVEETHAPTNMPPTALILGICLKTCLFIK
ncbi:MAG: hypothetical protein Q7T24_02295 [Deltaproteobacteria bacterium]|nr:hypothetical protein [Deltaproteobacteria bacterium]